MKKEIWVIVGVILGCLTLMTTLVIHPYFDDQKTLDRVKTKWAIAENFDKTNPPQIEEAIKIYRSVFDEISKEKFPEQYALTNYYLGINY